MLRIILLDQNTRSAKYDYVFDNTDQLYKIQSFLLPRFQGEWRVLLSDITVKETIELVDTYNLNDYIQVVVALNKLNYKVVMDFYPRFKEEKKSPYEEFIDFLATLPNPFEKKAVNYLYKLTYTNKTEVIETLLKMSANHTGTITLEDVQKEFSFSKHVYTRQVLADLLLYRTKRLQRWMDELGSQHAYASMYYSVKDLFKRKYNYLFKNGKDRKVANIDTQQLVVLYLLFVNSTSYQQLPGIISKYLNTQSNNDYKELLKEMLQ